MSYLPSVVTTLFLNCWEFSFINCCFFSFLFLIALFFVSFFSLENFLISMNMLFLVQLYPSTHPSHLLDMTATLNRDKASQKVWWMLNLTFLETKKRGLEELKLFLQRKLRDDLETAMVSRSILGSGYANVGKSRWPYYPL